MDYSDYIDLGFERTDTNDEVEFAQTGYYGFALEKQINSNMLICTSSGELNNPKLYIKKRNSETYHILLISNEIVRDLCSHEEL
jgi:hypothetical protein